MRYFFLLPIWCLLLFSCGPEHKRDSQIKEAIKNELKNQDAALSTASLRLLKTDTMTKQTYLEYLKETVRNNLIVTEQEIDRGEDRLQLMTMGLDHEGSYVIDEKNMADVKDQTDILRLLASQKYFFSSQLDYLERITSIANETGLFCFRVRYAITKDAAETIGMDTTELFINPDFSIRNEQNDLKDFNFVKSPGTILR